MDPDPQNQPSVRNIRVILERWTKILENECGSDIFDIVKKINIREKYLEAVNIVNFGRRFMQKRPTIRKVKVNDKLERRTIVRNVSESEITKQLLEANKIKKQFLEADKMIKTLPIVKQKHPDHMYTSKLINTREITTKLQNLKITQESKPSREIDSFEIPYL